MAAKQEESRASLLQALPEQWDAQDLPTYFRAHAGIIQQLCGVMDITPVIENFAADDSKDQDELHNGEHYLTIQFAQEGVAAQKSGQEWKINARAVVENLALAFKYLTTGSYDMGIVRSQRHIPSLLDVSHMTLDWEDTTLYPALRYKREETPLTPGDVEIIKRVISDGRTQAGSAYGGGIVKASRQ